jgi:lipopolysaccharide transport system permease protein
MASTLAPKLIEHSRFTSINLHSVWEYRELLYFIVWRDIKVRYKQTALGVLWILFQPLIPTIIFTIIFGIVIKIPTGSLPYPLFVFCGLLPWMYFAGATNRSSGSLLSNTNLITKVYFPRLILPVSGVLNGLIDFGIGFLGLMVLMFYYGFTPSLRILLLPGLLLMLLATALGIGLLLSSLGVRYRDVHNVTPFLLQIGLYATPVVYPVRLFPDRWQQYLGLNPMTGVVEAFRWSILGGPQPPQQVLLLSCLMTALLLSAGLFVFRQREKTFADIV